MTGSRNQLHDHYIHIRVGHLNKLQSKHIRADASVGIASLHAGPAVQNLKPHADALSHYTSVSIIVRSSNKLSCSSYSFIIKGIWQSELNTISTWAGHAGNGLC